MYIALLHSNSERRLRQLTISTLDTSDVTRKSGLDKKFLIETVFDIAKLVNGLLLVIYHKLKKSFTIVWDNKVIDKV